MPHDVRKSQSHLVPTRWTRLVRDPAGGPPSPSVARYPEAVAGVPQTLTPVPLTKARLQPEEVRVGTAARITRTTNDGNDRPQAGRYDGAAYVFS